MWHEARKQERKIRDIMVNYKKRAERRRAFYERIRTDPTTFLRIQGSNYKIHIDQQNSGDNINMMPWQGDKSVMIDRFDVRAHLDYIPEPAYTQAERSVTTSEEKRLNYERYRTLVMIEASGATEESYLKQLQQEEENPRTILEASEKKEKPAPKASIGYTYQNSNLVVNEKESDPSDDSESDLDLDIDVAVNVDELDDEQKDELDNLALKFAMEPGSYCGLLKADKDEAELVQKVKDEEEARSQLRGRRAKRDRRSLKDRQRGAQSTSPLSYLRKASPSYDPYSKSRSRSRSSSSGGEPTAVEYITEFGSQISKDAKSTNSDHSSSKKSSGRDELKRKHRKHENSEQSHRRSESKKSSLKKHEQVASFKDYGKSQNTFRSPPYESGRTKYQSRSKSRSPSPSYSRRSYRKSQSRSPSWESHERIDSTSNDKRTKAIDNEKKNLQISNVLKSAKTKSSSPVNKAKLTPQEKLKKRMHVALNKQLKMDKKEERKKKVEKEQERQARDDDLKEVFKKRMDRKRSRYSRSRSRSYSPEYN